MTWTIVTQKNAYETETGARREGVTVTMRHGEHHRALETITVRFLNLRTAIFWLKTETAKFFYSFESKECMYTLQTMDYGAFTTQQRQQHSRHGFENGRLS